jgi:branched-chain amino acid transport system permease protein
VEWVNAVVQGLLLGGQYALLACGLSLVFGVMRVVNLAHGVLAVAAAYVALWLVEQWSFALLPAAVVTVALFAALGYAIQRALFNPALGQGDLAPLLVSFGLAVVVTNLLQEGFSADSQNIDVGSLRTDSLRITDDLSVGLLSLLTLACGVVVIAAVQLFLARTRTGRAMRATSDDAGTAALMGIDNRHTYAVATAIAIAMVALAGLFLGVSTQFTPTYGDLVLIFAFEAVIIGGLGSLWGTLAGGLVLGVAQTVGAQVEPAYGVLAGHLVFLVVLMVRPSGLVAKAVRA